MSKKKGFEYQGSLNESENKNTTPNEDSEKTHENSIKQNQPNDENDSNGIQKKDNSNSNTSSKDNDSGQLDSRDNTGIKPQSEDMSEDNSDSNIRPQQSSDNNESGQNTSENNNKNTNNNETSEKEESESKQNNDSSSTDTEKNTDLNEHFDKNSDDANSSQSNNENNSSGDDESKSDDSKSNEKNEENEKNSSESEKSSDKGESSIGNLASESSGTLDTIKSAKKMKDIQNMSKEEAASELLVIGKGLLKDKLIAVVITYIGPFIVPIVLGILVLFILLLAITGAVTTTINNNRYSNDANKCTPIENSSSSNFKNSKDAKKNAESVYQHIMKNVDGATSKGTAALLGNMQHESGFNPKIVQGGEDFKESLAKDASIGGYAIGLAQWDSGRRANLIKYADKKDKKWSDINLQLDYLLNGDGSDSEILKKLVSSKGDVKSNTEDIMTKWERAGATESLPQRQAEASKYYTMFSNKETGKSSNSNIDGATNAASDNSDAGENSGCNTDGASKTDGELGKSIKANGNSGKILKQWKSKDDIPKKYKKHIELPDYKGEKLESSENIFPPTNNLGECTELTWSYLSQLWSGKQPQNGNGNVIYKAYKEKGAKTTNNPTVGYGFSSNPPYAGAALSSVGHTGVVIGVMDDGKWLMSNYNLNGEGSSEKKRVETFALVDGNKKEGAITFFSGIGDSKIKSKGK